MPKLLDFNPLKSIAVPNVGSMHPRGLIVVIGPNSSGKTQMLRDIQARLLGQPRKLVVCNEIGLELPPQLNGLLEVLSGNEHIRRRVDSHNHTYIDCRMPDLVGSSGQHWSLTESQVHAFFQASAKSDRDSEQSDPFFEHFGRFFASGLFLNRRLLVTNAVENFDYEEKPPANELQALYIHPTARDALSTEANRVFGKAIWLDNTRGSKLCLRVSDDGEMPSDGDKLRPDKMRSFRVMEDEGDGLKSYMGTCVTLLLGERPVCLIDEPELCLHPPQAYALGRFIGKYGVSIDRVTFVATHSSHVLRGIIEETNRVEILRLSRAGPRFSGRKVNHESIRACIEKPSTKVETILDGLFAEAVTVVESEADRLVYSTVWERIVDEFGHDVHFVSVGGIGGIADTCHLYRNLGIPVCAIADLDLLREVDTFGRIAKSLTSREDAEAAVQTCREIMAKIRALGPIYSEAETRSRLTGILDSELDWSKGEKIEHVRRVFSELSAGLSQTARLKKGIDSLAAQPVYHDLLAFLGRCRSFGLFLVPCGELEDWVPNLMAEGPSKNRKAEWANAAANKLREAPAGADDIWAFLRQMGQFQEGEAARLSGYMS